MGSVKVLITGCNGLLGCRLSRQLLASGYTVFGSSLRGLVNPYLSPENYTSADLRLPGSAQTLLDFCQPDILVHAAAITKPDLAELNPADCFLSNTKATEMLLLETKKRGIRFIHLSTDFVFRGLAPSHPETATDFQPCNVYGESKLQAEILVAQLDPKACIIRTALVFGFEPLLPRSNIFTWALSELQAGRSIRVVDDQFRTPTYADDLAKGIERVCQQEFNGILNLAGPDWMSVYAFVQAMAEVFGLDKSLILPVKTKVLNEPAKRPPNTRLIIQKAKTELGYAPSSVHSCLHELKNSLSGN